MHTLMGYLKRYRKECVIAPLFKMLETVMELLVPIMMKRMIDEGIAGGNRSLVWQTGLWLVAFGMLGFAFACTAQYFSARAAVGTCRSLRSALFEKIEHLDPAASEQIGVSTLINRMTGDMNQVQTGINLTLRLALRSPFVVFGAMAMAFTVNARLAWIFAVIIPALTAVVLIIGNITMKGHTGVQRRQDNVLKHTRENLTGVRVLRAFNRQAAETDGFRLENDQLLAQQEHVGKIQALLNPLTYVLVNLGLIVLLQNGGVSVWQGTVSVGCVVALCDYLSQILVELIKLTNLVNNITKAVACANRIEQVMTIPAVRTFGTAMPDWNSEDAVRFDHVTFTYPGAKHPALRDVSFTVRRGESIGIIGGTGSGKSTLASLLTRAYDPDSGTVTIAGCDAHEMPAADMLRGIGTVPQQASLFAGTVAENLRLGMDGLSDDSLWQALETAQAADFIREKPLGLEEECEQGGHNFSGGQRQRLTIARALARAPKLLILDDSTSALDYATEAALRGSLRHVAGMPSVIWISQRASAVRHADRILVLDDGEAVGFDTHEVLLRTCDEYREIVRSQHPEEVKA